MSLEGIGAVYAALPAPPCASQFMQTTGVMTKQEKTKTPHESRVQGEKNVSEVNQTRVFLPWSSTAAMATGTQTTAAAAAALTLPRPRHRPCLLLRPTPPLTHNTLPLSMAPLLLFLLHHIPFTKPPWNHPPLLLRSCCCCAHQLTHTLTLLNVLCMPCSSSCITLCMLQLPTLFSLLPWVPVLPPITTRPSSPVWSESKHMDTIILWIHTPFMVVVVEGWFSGFVGKLCVGGFELSNPNIWAGNWGFVECWMLGISQFVLGKRRKVILGVAFVWCVSVDLVCVGVGWVMKGCLLLRVEVPHDTSFVVVVLWCKISLCLFIVFNKKNIHFCYSCYYYLDEWWFFTSCVQLKSIFTEGSQFSSIWCLIKVVKRSAAIVWFFVKLCS